jgi:hypothetical protein
LQATACAIVGEPLAVVLGDSPALAEELTVGL